MFTLFTSVLNGKPTKSILDEPKRCCLPELFSAQISASSGIKLSDGTTVGTYVMFCLSQISFQFCFFCKSNRDTTIFHTI